MRNEQGQALLMAAVVGLAVCCGCSSDGSPTKAAAATLTPATATNAVKTAEQSYTTTAPVFTENEVDVVTQREGIVLSVGADIGERVHKGQVLATLDDRQLRADYESALAKSRSLDADSKNWEAEMKVAEADEERAKAMYNAQLMTREQFDHAHYKTVASQFEVERQKQDQITAEQKAEALNLELQKTKIVAPFDGVIARRYVRNGQHVMTADKMFWIIGDTPLKVRFLVPESEMSLVKAGGSVELASIYDSTNKAEGKIVSVSPAVDPATSSIEVIAELTKKNAGLKSGMTAQVTLHKN